MIKLAEDAVQVDEQERMSRLQSSSNFSISKLSPASQVKRHSNLKKEKSHYLKLAKSISKQTGIYGWLVQSCMPHSSKQCEVYTQLYLCRARVSNV